MPEVCIARPYQPPSPSLAQPPCPTPPTHPQVGIGPDAHPKRKKPNREG